MTAMAAIRQTYEVPPIHKQHVTVTVHEISCDDTDASESVGSLLQSGCACPHSCLHPNQSEKISRQSSRPKTSSIVEYSPQVSQWGKTKERLKLARQVASSTLVDLRSTYQPISQSHQYARRIVQPLATWGGKNHRVLTGHSLGVTTIQDGMNDKAVINAASHNYAGFYRTTTKSEKLHHLALQNLPVADTQSCPALTEALHDKLATFFSADFCTTMSTGYMTNLLAFAAILDSTWILLLDEKSHNSMFVGAYLSNVHKVVKFRHNDMLHLEKLLSEHSRHHQNIMVATEGLFSMDGTVPPLNQLAYLKNRYGFTLLVDEAHSLLSTGSTGHGCLELWNETNINAPVDDDLIDIRTATLSKSLGSVGGLVCGKSRFEVAVLTKRDELLKQGTDPLPTATMVQCLHILNQPTILRRHLARLRSISLFIRRELEHFGLHVYGDAITPLLPVHAGPPSLAAKMSYILRKKGILATPVSKPAVDFWESRIRVGLSADHDDTMVNALVRGLISAAQEIGIAKKQNFQPSTFSRPSTSSSDDEIVEAQNSFKLVKDLVLHDAAAQIHKDNHLAMIEAGHLARRTFGVPTGASRWISGTFSIHVEVEKLLAHCIGLPEAMTYTEHYLGLTSTIAALCRPMSPSKTHTFLLPKNVTRAVLDGIKIAPKSTKPSIEYYSNFSNLADSVSLATKQNRQVTLYLDTETITGESDSLSLSTLVATHKGSSGSSKPCRSLTILLYDSEQKVKTQQGQQQLREMVSLLRHLAWNVLVFGSFYRCFGVPGAYLVGTEEVIEELRYCSRGYMFTTAPLPFIMGMVAERLRNPAGV